MKRFWFLHPFILKSNTLGGLAPSRIGVTDTVRSW